ncbi:MAG: polysaccharide pyruvyl transferase family protein [Lachnospiraceae bacterium]|nr:polysaccharide pyruvyl transferase family protein [Lachnospiraceae bacterium]
MKADVITLHTVRNYGSVLQTYATMKVLNKLGYDVEFIDYWRESNTSDAIAKLILRRNRITSRIKLINDDRNPIGSFSKWFIRVMFVDKKNIFWEFITHNVNLTQARYYSFEELLSNYPVADVYISGSDQIWNSDWNGGVDRVFFLDFLPEESKRISYSSSIGKEHLDTKEISLFQKMLCKYSGITVRENSAKELLDSIGIKSHQVLDPTLMLTDVEWRTLAAEKQTIKGKYLLVYQLNDNPLFEKYTKELAILKGWQIIRIGMRRGDRKKIGRCLNNVTIETFLRLISDATCIITDSFHMTAFSLNFKVPFIVVKPKKYATRIESILMMTGTEDRILLSFDEYDLCDRKIGFDKVEQVLLSEREKSFSIMKKILID